MNDVEKLQDFLGCELNELELPIAGVYFLFDNDTVVYIGKSYDIAKRINYHRLWMPSAFNRVFYIEELDAKKRTSLERDLVHTFDPPLNVSYTRRYTPAKRPITGIRNVI